MRGKTLIQTHEYEHDDVIIRPCGSRLRYILVVDTGPLSVQKVVPFCEPILVRKHTTAGPGKDSTYPVRPTYKNGPFPDPSFGPPCWAGLWPPTGVETAADFVGNLRCFRISILNIHICLSQKCKMISASFFLYDVPLWFWISTTKHRTLYKMRSLLYDAVVILFSIMLLHNVPSVSLLSWLVLSWVTQFHKVDPCSATMKQICTQQMSTHMLLRLKLIAFS